MRRGAEGDPRARSIGLQLRSTPLRSTLTPSHFRFAKTQIYRDTASGPGEKRQERKSDTGFLHGKLRSDLRRSGWRSIWSTTNVDGQNGNRSTTRRDVRSSHASPTAVHTADNRQAAEDLVPGRAKALRG